MPGVAARLAATRVVDAVMHHGRSLKAELATALPALPDPRDRALAEALCFAVLRHHGRFDAALRAWIPKPLGRRDAELRSLLMVGLAQLDVLKLAPHAAVAATVDTARALGRTHQAAMVNAVLRRAGREGVPAGIGLQWPAWLRTRLQHDWGDDAATILEASSAEPPLWLRVNRQRGSREAYAARLAAAELAPHIDQALPDALRLDAGVPVSRLPGFAEGDVSVQDASAQLVADALPLASGLRVLDACAAPGGKSAHLLEREPGLQLVALDVDEARLQRVRETLRRVGLDANAHLQAADSTALDDWWNGEPFDAVLLDAPCSATGIVRRQPDVLLHRRESDLNTLLDTQRRLLDALWTTVAPGGVLLYATCSVLKAENEAQVQAFLERTPNSSVDALDERFGRSSGAGRQRLPGERGYDGFFYARLRKA